VALLSLHPRPAKAILSGRKTLELRRRPLHFAAGSRVLIYATMPEGALVGTVEVVRSQHPVQRADVVRPHNLRALCLAAEEARAYLDGASRPCLLHLTRPKPLANPLSLDTLRQRLPGFTAPQGFRWLSLSALALLGVPHE
jgi:predicted transcriptional regulator